MPVDSQAARVLSAAGAVIPDTPLPAMEWSELAALRNSLQRAGSLIVDEAEASGEALSGDAHDAHQEALAIIAAVKHEMEARDQLGDRAPRSRSGRLSTPTMPGASWQGPTQRGWQSPRFAGRPASYVALFGAPPAAIRDTGSFPSLGAFLIAAAMNPLDPRFRATNAGMTEEYGEDGGFAVPPGFYANLLDASLEEEVIRPRATVIPMDSSMVAAPSFDYTDQTGAKRAGLVLTWMGESAPATNQVAKLTPIHLRANKGGIWIAVSNEAAEDIPLFERRIVRVTTDAITAGLDLAFLFGNGAGQPLGIMNSPALVTVTKESGQAPATINEDNIVKMSARLHPSSWSRAVWLMSPTCVAQVYKLAQAAGPNQGVRTAVITETDQGLRILGKEVIVTDACAPLGTTGDIIFGDLSKYLIGLRREARLQTSVHSGWSTDEIGVRMVLRLGGQPEWKAPIKLRDGTNTVSAFVALETRA